MILLKKFMNRVRKQQIKEAFYLSYFYSYLILYDHWYQTEFAHSQSAEELHVPKGGTGNFPAHPRLVKKFLRAANLRSEDQIIDVGCGSGMILHVAYRLGFKNLSGIEVSDHVFSFSQKNLSGKNIYLHQGDALQLDLTKYSAITFFSPFRGELAKQFFKKLPPNINAVIVVNHDKCIEPVLVGLGFFEAFVYQHPIYMNFNGKVYKR